MASVLNLAIPNDIYGIDYKVSEFPDGQQSILILNPSLDKDHYHLSDIGEVTIKSRMNSFRDLELIICAASALRELGVNQISLYIPYCLGGRSDRKFSIGGFNYIKNVIAPIINIQNFSSVTIMDPHSDVLEACISRFNKKTNHNLVRWALADFSLISESSANVKLVSPDAGALKKVYEVAENIGYKDSIVIAAKHRDMVTGKITRTEVPLDSTNPDNTFFILDDICDGGRTFIEIAKVIKSHVWRNGEYFRGKIFLVVTHGIFSAGFQDLKNYFDGIYTTNSISDMVPDEEHQDFVKKYNVF